MSITSEEAILALEELRDWDGLPYCIKEPMQREGIVVITQEVIDTAIKTLQQRDVFEKIKAEILDEAEYAYADFDQYKEDILHAEPDELPDDDFRYGMERAVEIINKYRKGGAE